MFIVLDGPDGSGKSTLAKSLVETLRQEKRRAVYTLEPTNDSEAGKRLRQMMRTGEIPDLYAFADLFVADRRAHIASYIEPALNRGEIVVCDRYKYSALAYQQLQGVDAAYLIEQNRTCLVPDFVFILMPRDADVLLQRIALRASERDVFEERKFLTDTLKYYQKLPEYFPEETIIFLEAEAAVEENIEKVKQHLFA